MRRLIISACFLATLPTFAFGQERPLPPNVQALQQTVLKLTGEALDWQTRAIELQGSVADAKAQDEQHKAAAETAAKDALAKLADLQKQLADAKKPAQETK